MTLIVPIVPSGVKLKLARAQVRLDAINSAVQQYADEHVNPITLVGELNGLEFTLRLPPIPQIDETISVDIGEFLHNLRSALDQTTFAMLQANLPTSAGLTTESREKLERDSQFPITDNSTAFAAAHWRVAGLESTAKAAIERLQPYYGGSNPVGRSLWCLREMSNTDKHRAVHPTVAVLANASIDITCFPLSLPYQQVWNSGPLEDEAVLVKLFFHYPPETVQVRTHGGLAVALYTGWILLGSVEPVLRNIYKRVKEAVDTLAYHCNSAI